MHRRARMRRDPVFHRQGQMRGKVVDDDMEGFPVSMIV